MKEIVLEKKKNGMAMLLVIIFGIILSVAGIVIGGICIEENTAYFGVPLLIVSILAMVFFFILTAGLKVLKPQEALVLTLFGKYVGTLKNEGFYFVHPFCTAFNPAAKTKLNQSGDVAKHQISAGSKEAVEIANNKISLKN